MSDFAVILPAAGQSSRFGGPVSKIHAELRGRSVLHRSLSAFLDRDEVRQVVIPTRVGADGSPDGLESVRDLLADERLDVCGGGKCRAESVLFALRRVRADLEWVAVHDAARPLVSRQLIDMTLAEARQRGAAVPALPVALTIKQATGPLPAAVRRTVPRHELWAMQTPQIMRRADLLAAFESCPIPLDQVTDDVQLLELAGMPVWLTPGEERNLKITTAMDLKIAALFLD
jgi:2-C-methyl-D-erythritol 4-phosphate cytidylyltransferase